MSVYMTPSSGRMDALRAYIYWALPLGFSPSAVFGVVGRSVKCAFQNKVQTEAQVQCSS